MPRSNSTMIHKLQNAINDKYSYNVLYNTSQFYSDDQERPVTIYTIKKSVYDKKKGRNVNIELFHSTSQIQIVLFLRDLWYQLEGLEIPTDNEEWNRAKELYFRKVKEKEK